MALLMTYWRLVGAGTWISSRSTQGWLRFWVCHVSHGNVFVLQHQTYLSIKQSGNKIVDVKHSLYRRHDHRHYATQEPKLERL